MAVPASTVSAALPGVTVIGDLNAANGLGDAGRRVVEAMIRRGIALDFAEIPYKFHRRTAGPKPEWLRSLPRGYTHEINLLIYSFAELHEVDAGQLRQYSR